MLEPLRLFQPSGLRLPRGLNLGRQRRSEAIHEKDLYHSSNRNRPMENTMPSVQCGRHRIHYELRGDPGRPVIVFLNGLTQNARLWEDYAAYFVPRGYRVLAYDMLGQGRSSKPVIDIQLRHHAELLDSLLNRLELETVHLAGISFGGFVALDFAIRYGHRLQSLTVMSTFAELTPQLEFLGAMLLQGLTEVGMPYLQQMLYPMNMSSAWIDANRARIPSMMRNGYIGNDAYAMQNLMESFVELEPLTPGLSGIEVPTLIMNGEHDFFTPRECHERIRKGIENSRLLIIQQAYHAFTIEKPAVTMRQLEVFLSQVTDGRWKGDQSVWVASDDPGAAQQWLPCIGDWMRAVQFASPDATKSDAVVGLDSRHQVHSQEGNDHD
ncbi:alpha/beta hydrolase [Thiohalocapsa marina]|uniref:Alpha/beta hydrolase n=1 Tax=Thiohalocapsa marina TaxID=424902 RepID=A0A5M8FT12_9GAMM|nr:alpha/beta hydrolase [Thiohalocapsa marina]KAA6186672.1 alpha/beta hydrolase [Thiohalocapsa marina]